MPRERFTVKDVAKLLGVTIRTLHHYDEIGLLKPSARTPKGYRLYYDDDIVRLRKLLQLRERGFTLDAARQELGTAQASRSAVLTGERDALRGQMELLGNRLRGVEAALEVLQIQDAVKTEAEASSDWKLTRWRTQKLKHAFAMLDSNRDGRIEEIDFELVADRVCDLQPGAKVSPERTHVRYHLHAQWELLRAGKTRGIDEIEWLEVFEHVLPTPSFKRLIEGYADALMDVVDVDHDGRIWHDDVVRLQAAHGVPMSAAEVMWSKTGRDRASAIRRNELRQLVGQFFFSDDPDAPGGFFFGPLVVAELNSAAPIVPARVA